MIASVHGRLGRDPKMIETRSGNPMCVSSLAVDLSDRDGEFHTQWLNVVGFGRNAELLARQKKGDLASISGRCQINRWVNGDGQQQVQLSIIVDSINSSRAVQPSNMDTDTDSQSCTGKPSSNNTTDGALLDDDIPF